MGTIGHKRGSVKLGVAWRKLSVVTGHWQAALCCSANGKMHSSDVQLSVFICITHPSQTLRVVIVELSALAAVSLAGSRTVFPRSLSL